jgi:hypothetical protein
MEGDSGHGLAADISMTPMVDMLPVLPIGRMPGAATKSRT